MEFRSDRFFFNTDVCVATSRNLLIDIDRSFIRFYLFVHGSFLYLRHAAAMQNLRMFYPSSAVSILAGFKPSINFTHAFHLEFLFDHVRRSIKVKANV